MIADLSHPIAPGMPVYPGDPEVDAEPALTLAEHGVAVTALWLGSHSGTHADAPSHSVAGGAPIDAVALERLWGPARVLRASAADDEQVALAAVEAQLDDWSGERIALLATGWDAHWGTARMLRHPSVAPELADALLALGVDVLGVDALSPDPTGADGAPTAFPVHERWLGSGGLILENLRGLGAIPDRIELVALPLRLVGVDGSPVRAVARW